MKHIKRTPPKYDYMERLTRAGKQNRRGINPGGTCYCFTKKVRK